MFVSIVNCRKLFYFRFAINITSFSFLLKIQRLPNCDGVFPLTDTGSVQVQKLKLNATEVRTKNYIAGGVMRFMMAVFWPPLDRHLTALNVKDLGENAALGTE